MGYIGRPGNRPDRAAGRVKYVFFRNRHALPVGLVELISLATVCGESGRAENVLQVGARRMYIVTIDD